jgi:hypothetical protein
LPTVEAAQALADLVEISSQIESAVLAQADGTVLSSTLGDEAKASAVATEALALLDGAGEATHVQAVLPEGSVFVVKDGERVVAAVTGRDPTAGLVFYDLKTCLRLAGEEPAKKKVAASSRRKKKEPEDVGEEEATGEE